MEPTILHCTTHKALGAPAVVRDTILSTEAYDFNVAEPRSLPGICGGDAACTSTFSSGAHTRR